LPVDIESFILARIQVSSVREGVALAGTPPRYERDLEPDVTTLTLKRDTYNKI
jgi:hypothetical protein